MGHVERLSFYDAIFGKDREPSNGKRALHPDAETNQADALKRVDLYSIVIVASSIITGKL